MKSIYLYPGQLAALAGAGEISTLLGSCVAVCLQCRDTSIGGMNHYLLAHHPANEAKNPRYGSVAIPLLIEEMVKLGANPARLQAKIYGGGKVLSAVNSAVLNVGEKNIQVAREMLAERGIRIVEEDVGGEHGRKIAMQVETFEIRHLSMGKEAQTLQADLTSHKEIKVGIVDDSLTVRNLFQRIFTKHGLTVVGTAANSYEAREMIVQHKPDVITLDIEMPKMSGVAFLEKLMKHHPIPVVMVSSLTSDGAAAAKALELGAIEYIQKPSQFDVALLGQFASSLVEKVSAAAHMNVVQRLKSEKIFSESAQSAAPSRLRAQSCQVVAVAGHTGSQKSLLKAFTALAKDTPPIVVTCSPVVGFINEFAAQLEKVSGLKVRVATQDVRMNMGEIILCPPSKNLIVKGQAGSFVASPQDPSPAQLQVPSGDTLFNSVAQSAGPEAVGLLVSGFGSDGVDGLLAMRAAGAMTLCEDPQEASYPFAPHRALAMGAADQSLALSEFAALLLSIRSRMAVKSA